MVWEIVGGPRELKPLGSSAMDIRWSYDLEHEGDRRTISVIVTAGLREATDLSDECRAAISSAGRSAVDRVRDRDAPPRFLVVTNTGITERHA